MEITRLDDFCKERFLLQRLKHSDKASKTAPNVNNSKSSLFLAKFAKTT